CVVMFYFFFQAEDGIRDFHVTGVQTCALPILEAECKYIIFMKNVPQITPQEAAAFVKNGDTLLQGGFGMTGNPVHLMHALAETRSEERRVGKEWRSRWSQ